MTNNPIITVITAVYNGELYLPEAIESVLNQTFTDFEYTIVDDGSTDNTSKIIEQYARYDSRIRSVRIKNSGPANARNMALEMAKGAWIAVLDADDIAMPDRLSEQLKFVQDNNRVVLLGGSCIEIDKDGNALKKHIYPKEHDALMSRLENGKAFFPHSSAFFNKACVMELGGYNPKFTRSQDYDLLLRIGETAFIACLQIPVVKLRKHSQMISNTNQGRLQTVMGLCARICHFRRKAGLSDPSQMDEDVWQDFLKWGEKRMGDEGSFQQMQGWHVLRNAWYSNPKENKLKRGMLIVKELIQNPLARKAFMRRFRKDNLALKLAEESKRIFT